MAATILFSLSAIAQDKAAPGPVPKLLPVMTEINALAQAHRLNEAHQVESNWLAHSKPVEDFYLELAGTYYSNRLSQETKRVVDDGIKRFPQSFELHMFRARTWLGVGELDLAQPDLDICQKLLPHSPDVHYEVAGLLNDREKYDSALKEINLALSIEDKNPTLWILKGCILRNLNREPESIEALSRGVTLGKNFAQFDMTSARTVLARQLHKIKNYPEALAQYKEVEKLHKRAPYKLNVELGEVYLDMDRPEDALSCFDKSLTVDDEYIPAHRGRLAALEKLKKTEQALKEKEAIKALETDFKPMR